MFHTALELELNRTDCSQIRRSWLSTLYFVLGKMYFFIIVFILFYLFYSTVLEFTSGSPPPQFVLLTAHL